jgi:hypothetical protein
MIIARAPSLHPEAREGFKALPYRGLYSTECL